MRSRAEQPGKADSIHLCSVLLTMTQSTRVQVRLLGAHVDGEHARLGWRVTAMASPTTIPITTAANTSISVPAARREGLEADEALDADSLLGKDDGLVSRRGSSVNG